jgi:hypothetical protein
MCRRHPHPSTSRPPLPIPPKHRETSPVLDGAGMRRTAGDQTCLREPDALGTAFPIVSAQDAHLHIEAHCAYQHSEPMPSSIKNAGADPRPLDLSASRPMALATHSPDEDYDCSPADLAQARVVYTEHPSVSCIDVPLQGAQNHWLAMEREEEIMQILVTVPSAAGEGEAGAATVTLHVTRSRARLNQNVQAGEARLDKSSKVSKSTAKSESL